MASILNNKETSPLNRNWPDSLHWLVIQHLTFFEDGEFNPDAFKYIQTIVTETGRTIADFLNTYQKNENFKTGLKQCQKQHQISQVKDLIKESKYSSVDSDEEEAHLQNNGIDASFFAGLSAQKFAPLLQKLATSGNWKAIELAIQSRKPIPANTYSILIREAAIQGASNQFRSLLQKRPVLNYNLLIRTIHRIKLNTGFYEIIHATGHYGKMNLQQQQELDQLHQKGRC